MTHYSVLAVTPTTDEWIADYIGPATELVAQYGGKYLARTSSHREIEGADAPAALHIVIKWPSRGATNGFTNAAEYAPSRTTRAAGSEGFHFIIEGRDDLARVETELPAIPRAAAHTGARHLGFEGKFYGPRPEAASVLKQVTLSCPNKNCTFCNIFGDKTFRRTTPEELTVLRVAGVSMICTGLEYGDPHVPEQTRKRMTPENMIEGMTMARNAGIRVLLSFLFGHGDRDRSREHIEATVHLLNITQPDEIAPKRWQSSPERNSKRRCRTAALACPFRCDCSKKKATCSKTTPHWSISTGATTATTSRRYAAGYPRTARSSGTM